MELPLYSSRGVCCVSRSGAVLKAQVSGAMDMTPSGSRNQVPKAIIDMIFEPKVLNTRPSGPYDTCMPGLH